MKEDKYAWMLEKNKTDFTKKYVKWNNASIPPQDSTSSLEHVNIYIYIKAYGKEK